MRLKIRLDSKNSVTLPIHYNYTVQGFIYSHLDPVLREKLHNNGISYGKRQYKMFTFSILYPHRIKREHNHWIMQPPLDLYISSYDDNILESFALELIRKKQVNIGKNTLRIDAIMVIVPPEYEQEVIIKTMSPITIHSTQTVNGKRYTNYFSPHDPMFSQKIQENLKRKFRAIFNTSPEEDEDFLELEPIKINSDPAIIYYKDYIIKGWKGIFKLKTSPIYFNLAYLTGLGARNSLGFGMWKPISNSEELRKFRSSENGKH